MSFDIIIKNGKIIDGAGNPWYRADVGIKNGKIAKIGRLDEASALKALNADGLVVCPGFIDPHSHSDRFIPFNPKVESTIHQGITTLVVGQCGASLAPITPEHLPALKKSLAYSMPPGEELDITWNTFAEYLAEVEKLGCSANVIPLVGFGLIRLVGGPGYEDREPTAEELEQMKDLAAEAMEAGAFGMSTGLIYTPQVYAKTDEIIEVAKVVAKYDGLYFTHIRNEGGAVVEAVKEAIEIVEKSGCIGGQISHHKIAGNPYWGTSKTTLRLIENANARDLDITADQYPYNRGLTSLNTILPPWVHVGGAEKILERVQNPADRERIKKDVTEGIEGWENWIRDVGFDRIYIATVKTEQNRRFEGKSIAEITNLKGKTDDWQTLWDLLLEEQTDVTITVESMDEEDIRRIMRGRYTMVGTDSRSVAPTGILSFGKPHPRYYGTYPRILGKYVREEGVLTLEDAIRRMTSFPAQRMGVWDRGLLRERMWADVVVFDPDTVIDRATYSNPHQFPEGIIHVIVNGQIVVKNDKQTEKLPGKILRRPT